MEAWVLLAPGAAPRPPARSITIPQHTLLFVILLAQLWSPYFSRAWDTLSGEKAEDAT